MPSLPRGAGDPSEPVAPVAPEGTRAPMRGEARADGERPGPVSESYTADARGVSPASIAGACASSHVTPWTVCAARSPAIVGGCGLAPYELAEPRGPACPLTASARQTA